MCAIFGFGFQEGSDISVNHELCGMIKRMFSSAEVAGRSASGLVLVSKDRAILAKNNVNGRAFTETEQYYKAIGKFENERRENRMMVIGHCRMPTKGSEENNDNNHPIVTGKIVGVHNGVIGNDDDLFDAYGPEGSKLINERHNIKRIAKVDSEIIFALLNYNIHVRKHNVDTSIKLVSNSLRGSFACSFVDTTEPHILWIFRNSPGCAIYHFFERGLIVFATRELFIKESVNGEKLLGAYRELLMPNESLIGIDLKNNEIMKNSIPKVVSGDYHRGECAGMCL